MGVVTGLLVWWGCYRHNCWSGILVQFRHVVLCHTCVMVKMSADPVTIMAGLLVWYKYNRHVHWPGAAWIDMPDGPVQQYPAFLLVGCNFNIHYCWCDATNTHACWFRVSLTGMCSGSVPHNGKDVWCDDLVAIHGCCLVKLHQGCLLLPC